MITKPVSTKELVINWHITETCNYHCRFCYSKWNNPSELHRVDGANDKIINVLADFFIHDANWLKKQIGYSSVRLNFAGGEPLLLKCRLIAAIKKAKKMGFKVSIITNGHYLSDHFIDQTASMLDMVGISFDSQCANARNKIGRIDRHGVSFSNSDLCDRIKRLRNTNSGIDIKINTVVNALNWQEDFSNLIAHIKPVRWKVLQVLPVLQCVELSISPEQFTAFVDRHDLRQLPMVVENNQCMAGSYLMLDPMGRFYQNVHQRQGYDYSQPVLHVGVEQALSQIAFSPEHFAARYAG